jgi:hypothetical protein
MAADPLTRLVLHFTHVDNLELIAREGLWCDREVVAKGLLKVEAGNREIKQARRQLPVTAGPGGCPADYVPFYFAPRSPMMFAIYKGRVPEYQEGLAPIVYLVTTIGAVLAAGLRFVFSDGNCGSVVTDYGDDLARLDELVDWGLMRERYWADTPDDPDRRRRRMAEFLVHERVPWELFGAVVAMTEQTSNTVRGIMGRLRLETDVLVKSGWYYP